MLVSVLADGPLFCGESLTSSFLLKFSAAAETPLPLSQRAGSEDTFEKFTGHPELAESLDATDWVLDKVAEGEALTAEDGVW